MRTIWKSLIRLQYIQAVKGRRPLQALYDFIHLCVGVVMRMTGDRNIAAELLQETFINVHRSLGKFKSESAVSTWIYRIAYNAVLNYANKQTRFRSHQLYDDNKFVRNETGGYEMKDLVEKVLSQLSVEERFLLVARE
jgi:RNA polymerase sigma-70 factor (ECF subfamily)